MVETFYISICFHCYVIAQQLPYLCRSNEPLPIFLCVFPSTLSQVRTFDQVMFESVKTEGQFLHCSVRFFEYIRQHLHSEW